MDDQQPQDWSVDRVVYEMCHNDNPAWAVHGLKPIPNKEQLESVFRDNDVDGSVLLEDLTPETLKDELNLTSLGQRKALEKVIRFLRGGVLPSLTPAPLSLREKIYRYQNSMPTPDLSRRSPYPQSAMMESVYGGTAFAPGQRPHDKTPIPDWKQPLFRDKSQLPGGRLVESTALDWPAEFRSQANDHQDLLRGGQQHNSMAVNADTQNFIEDHMADAATGIDLLDGLETTIDQNLRPTAAIAQVRQKQHDEPEPEEQELEIVEVKRKRRIAPTFVRPLQPKTPVTQSYLQQVPMSMQDTFFSHESDADSDDSFVYSSPPATQVTSLVIARRIKHFMQQRPRKVPGLPYNAVYLLPYHPRQCAGAMSEPYLYLFSQNTDTLVQKLQDWPEIMKDADRANVAASRRKVKKDSIVAVFEAGQFAAQSQQGTENSPSPPSDLGDYAWLLDNNPPMTDDDVLPHYGDSGDENDFDEETWEEIEEEQREREVKSSGLKSAQIAQAIDEATTATKQKWQTRKLPKVKAKAYRLWMRVAKAKKRSAEVNRYYAIRSHKNASLQKMRESILKDKWSSVDEVKVICGSLEETLFQILEAEHMLDVLHQNDPPEKPQPQSVQRQPRSKPVDKDGEETLDSESDDNFVAYDGLDVAKEDPRDEDFNPNISHSSARRTAPNLAVVEDVVMPEIDELEDMPVNDDSESVAEPQTGPEPSAMLIDDNNDADVESESDNIGSLLNRTKRKHSSQARLSITSEDWSSSQKASPEVPPSIPRQIRRQTRQGSDPENSDLDAQERLPSSKFKKLGGTKEQAIELLSSDPARPEDDSSGGFDSVTTPPLNPDIQESEDELVLPSRSRRQASNRVMAAKKEPSSESTTKKFADNITALEKALGTLHAEESEAIQRISLALSDRPRVFKRDCLGDLLKEGLVAMTTFEPYSIKGLSAQSSQTVRQITELFLSFMFQENLVKNQPNNLQVNEAHAKYLEHERIFEEQLANSLTFYSPGRKPALSQNKTQLTKGSKAASKRKFAQVISDSDRARTPDDSDLDGLLSGDEDLQEHTPHKKRKRVVAQSQEAKTVQKNDQARVLEQERRRNALSQKMLSVDADASAKVMVNTIEPLIMLDDYIASRVKPHQIHGIQFLWREIVADPRRQGCLLAHTMGLGKTMQVISLLITIRQASINPDAGVSEQVPPHLHENKTLVLCPSSLVENWYDELLMWTPPNDYDVLGGIFKISGRAQAGQIEQWAEDGGVLIISYDTLRSLLKPAGKVKQQERDKVESYEKWLLRTPSIVVADEAHKLKNRKTSIADLAAKFKTKSRIALTGSPLNNHLEEYHTMIEWIAKNYLGDINQFKSKYIEPINMGLYKDSTPYEQRVCLRKLHTLKKDIEPKVSRADISAIEDDMPQKTEYIMTIPLTPGQHDAYLMYVNTVLGQRAGGATTKSGGLFKWISALQVLLAHPSCFVEVCEKHRETAQAYDSSTETDHSSDSEARNKLVELTNEYDPMTATKVSNSDLAAEEAAVAVFDHNQEVGDLYAEDHSHRTLITKKIVEKAVACGDKTLVFSHSIPTLDYLEKMLKKIDPHCMRIDGSTKISERQKMTKTFNDSGEGQSKVFLLSTQAAGLGLNLQGANRVILFDFGFNQYVFVYRFKTGGTFEEPIHHKSLFKTQLFQRVVDKKNPTRAAAKTVSEYIFAPKYVKQEDLSEYEGRDPLVLDQIVQEVDTIRNLQLTETFERDDGEVLTAEELKVANEEQEHERLRREDPAKWAQAIYGNLAQRTTTDGQHSGPKVPTPPKIKMQQSKALFSNMVNDMRTGDLAQPVVGSAHLPDQQWSFGPLSQLPHGRPAQLNNNRPTQGQIDGAIQVDSSDNDSTPDASRDSQVTKARAAGCKNQ
ncbi:uncharacterized protein AB675_6027 [Cyphellophora attinorum]|uniref:Protein CHROMATIN REMODELING 20 n=1 Tax=Cyphellophora attinorum TaxID=1664694 RepID=A0A0N1H067_9EURO|nr:uncharacterized protein AB675_6027 [Phialophora attinorum]KPI36997.1 hypothetical protein AB675_6027 [Phialophora attinorum]